MPPLDKFTKCPKQNGDIVEVQARGRFVEKKERSKAAVIFLFGKVTGQFEPLRFSSGERRQRLSQTHVGKPYFPERRKWPQHLRRSREKRARIIDGHLQNIGDGNRRTLKASALERRSAVDRFLVLFRDWLQGDLKDFRPVPCSIAVRTPQVHIREKLHFHALEAVSTAPRTPANARIKTESARGISALAGKGLVAEIRADGVECAHVTSGIGPSGFADWRLVDHDHIADKLVSAYFPIGAGFFHGP